MKITKRALSGRETALIAIFLLLLLSLACWRLLFSPLRQTLIILREEQAALIHEQERMLKQLQRREDLLIAWDEWQTRAADLHEAVPSHEQLPQVLARLESLLDASPVTIHSLRIGQFEPVEEYSALRVRLRVSGDMGPLLVLLKSLEQFEHILLIELLSWAQDGDHAAVLELSFMLAFYDRQ